MALKKNYLIIQDNRGGVSLENLIRSIVQDEIRKIQKQKEEEKKVKEEVLGQKNVKVTGMVLIIGSLFMALIMFSISRSTLPFYSLLSLFLPLYILGSLTTVAIMLNKTWNLNTKNILMLVPSLILVTSIISPMIIEGMKFIN